MKDHRDQRRRDFGQYTVFGDDLAVGDDRQAFAQRNDQLGVLLRVNGRRAAEQVPPERGHLAGKKSSVRGRNERSVRFEVMREPDRMGVANF